MGTIVETLYGKIEGREDRGVQAFLGIPFAKPPLGPLRFRAPVPPEPWPGVRDATRFGKSAPQNPMALKALPGMDVGEQAEDCLYLNVYTPVADAGHRPVLVWIHGGGFFIGSGSQIIYDGVPLASRGDVVVVTLNYRLGALGFLRCADVGASGNAGFEDQMAALRFVRDNIAAFGGDPENVTVFGESAGGMSVGALLGAPGARGLFRRAIPQSGAAHNVHSAESADAVARDYLAELGLSEATALRECSIKQLLEAQLRLVVRNFGGPKLLPFQPVIDGQTLPVAPLDAVRDGSSAGVSLLVGTCRDEWRLFAAMDSALAQLDEAGFEERVEARVPGAGLASAYRDLHPGRSLRERCIAFETDRVFRIPALRLAEAQRRHSEDVYLYRVDWESPAFGGMLGACHAIDLAFCFGVLDKPGIGEFVGAGAEAEALSAAMMDAWLAFARSGDPGHSGLPDWPAYDVDRESTLIFGTPCALDPVPLDALCKAWQGQL